VDRQQGHVTNADEILGRLADGATLPAVSGPRHVCMEVHTPASPSPSTRSPRAAGRWTKRRAIKTLITLWHELRPVRHQGSGAIVKCSSLGGLVGLPRRAAYHASEHGVIGLTRSAVSNTRHAGIRINAIYPAPSTPQWTPT
jgi:NAD(P)-dependent dehydrogenase (short-subunit alcohol dehydrogenase family)